MDNIGIAQIQDRINSSTSTITLIQDRINSSTGAYVSFYLLEDIIWSLTTDPELMAELNRRHADWKREMELNHGEP